jgi:outer membrane cobalamin receptor
MAATPEGDLERSLPISRPLRRPRVCCGALARASGPILLAGLILCGAPAISAETPAGDAGAVVLHGVTVTGQTPMTGGPTASASGANDYAVTAQDIADLPTGATSPLTDVLAQMPGVAIDQNQQIHIRNTEGPQFQYQINGVLVPLDINTNPPFLSMINPQFIKRLDLLDGVLPARYSYATGGVVDIQTKTGCEQPGGEVGVTAGMLETAQLSAQYGGCALGGQASYYVSGLYKQGANAFSSATPGSPIHDTTHQGQAFGVFSYALDSRTKLSLVLSAAASDNQLPDVPNLSPMYILAGVSGYQSQNINSTLNFRDYLGILALDGSAPGGATWRLAYSAHFISQAFRPDTAGELIFQGVASTATHYDIDNTLQGDLTWRWGAHTLSAGFYAADYRVTVDDRSLVFPTYLIGERLDGERIGGVAANAPPPSDPDAPNGPQASTKPESIVDNIRADNVVLGVYLSDLWRITSRLKLDVGVRVDSLSGFTNHVQFDPTVNLSYQVTPRATAHAGFARYMQVPSFQGISPNASTAFGGTTGGGPPGVSTPLTESDQEWDAGVVYRPTPHLTLSQDGFWEITDHYLDTGQFGVVPIFAPFNYGFGRIWGSETAVNYRAERLSAYVNLTLGENRQKGVATGQFNFTPSALTYIDAHAIPLDHQPRISVSAGVAYRLAPYLVSVSGIYSSGLRSGFADSQALPAVAQVNAALERRFTLPGGGALIDRLTLVNAFDRINLIRPAEGIGIFQAAYGPRFTVLDSLTVPF